VYAPPRVRQLVVLLAIASLCVFTSATLLLRPAAAHAPVAVDTKWLFWNTVRGRTSAYPLPEHNTVTPSEEFTTLTYGDETWLDWKNNQSSTVTIYGVEYQFRLRHLASGQSPELVHSYYEPDETIVLPANSELTIRPPSFSYIFQPDPDSYTVQATTWMKWSSFYEWDVDHAHDWTQE
jgi:hypothetical protein